MPSKKRRSSLSNGRDNFPSTPARISLATLPIEIIAEILLCTCSPPTALAVSRTCSFLYHSLAKNPDASFIWRRVRQSCEPIPLPDPGDSWGRSEADYAAFVFGGGICEVCEKPTRAIYVSFAARIRLCGSWHCRKKYLSDFLVNITDEFQGQDPLAIWVPAVESMRCFYPSRQAALVWPHGELLYRKRDWEEFKRQYSMYNSCVARAQAERKLIAASTAVAKEDQQTEHFLELCRKAKERLPRIMEVSIRLTRWKWRYDTLYKAIRKENDSWTKNLAESEGWDLADLVASQTYGSLQRRKTTLLEKIELKDVGPLRSVIESELLTLQGRHKRQNAEATYKEKLTEIKKVYERMRSGAKGASDTVSSGPSEPCILPPLSVFCSLPSVRTLKGSPDPSALPASGASAPSDIDSPLALSLISTDVHNWLVPVEKHLMTLLGYPNGWQSASKRTVPPLKRVTARFFCRRCGQGKVSKAYQRERCLDFRGVCAHVCLATQRKGIEGPPREAPEEREVDASTDDRSGQDKGKGKGKQKSGGKASGWDVEVFEKDEKATTLVEMILTLKVIAGESPNAITALKELGGIIRCTTCTGWIVMDFDTAVGHAHRHASMQVQLLPRTGPALVRFYDMPDGGNDGRIPPIIPTSRLVFKRGITELLLGPAYRGRSLCKKVNYGCKHCFVVEGDRVIANDKAVKGKGPRPMNFNGLRSHVKEKHGIHEIGDEDFFCYTSVQS